VFIVEQKLDFVEVAIDETRCDKVGRATALQGGRIWHWTPNMAASCS